MKLRQSDAKTMASLMDEAAGNLRGLMDTARAEELQVREWLPDELEGSAGMLRDHFAESDIDQERTEFEAAAYAHFVTRRAQGKLDRQLASDQGGDETPEALFWKQPDGSYGVLMFNAAFWGWKAARGLL